MVRIHDGKHTSVVQWTERWTSKPCVAGSIPARGAILLSIQWGLTQLVEWRTVNSQVAGSRPASPAMAPSSIG